MGHLLKHTKIFFMAVLVGIFSLPFYQAFAQDEGPKKKKYSKDASTEINVKNADIAAVIRIFSKKTKRNYILDERVRGKISIYLPGKVSSEEAIRILDSVLALKGFTSVPIGENLWKIVPSKEAIQSTIPTVLEKSESIPTAAVVTRLLPLKFVSAEDAKALLSPLVSSNGLMNAYTGTNSLIIIDSEDNVERLVKIIDSLDVPFSDREMTIIPIKYAEAVDISDKLNEILSESSDSSSGGSMSSTLENIRARIREGISSRSSSKSNSASSSSSASGTTISARAREPKIIADERTNSIIVVADEDLTARIRALISQLDSEVDLSGFRFYVYRCQHANAEELADVLSGLGDGGGSNRTSRTSSSPFSTASSNINTGSRERGGSFAGTQSRLASQRRTPGRSRSENSLSSGTNSPVNLGEDISITADPATNSLIIYAGKTDYEKIKTLLKKLDIKRRQVLVEAMLLEVGIDDSTLTSIDFLSSAGGDDGGVFAKSTYTDNLATLISDPTQLSNFSVAAATSGSLTLPNDIVIPTQTILLNAAQSNSNVNVLSAPNILATDNEQAEIIVGQNVPFLASKSTSGDNLNNTFNQIDRQDVGITLRITPQISSGDFVRLEIFTEVSSVVLATVTSELGPTTTVRTSETVVSTKNGQMVVIGGLMTDDISEADSGVPFLKDVPVLGHLFKSHSTAHQRKNLLIFITPRIIQDQFDARDTTVLHRERTEKVLDENDLYPKRQDILKNVDIDRVTEAKQYDGQKPSTIRAPKHMSPPQTKTRAKKVGKTIELTVSPKFAEEVEESAPTRGSLKVEKVTSKISAPGKRYVVVEILHSDDMTSLPFAVSKDASFGALVIPPDSSTSAKNFFRVGQLYNYETKEGKTLVKPVGIFANESEVEKLFPDITNQWHTLSPFEIMSLGKGPWTNKNSE